MKALPVLKGLDVTKDQLINANKKKELIRLGLHISSKKCNISCPYCLNEEGIHYVNNDVYNSKATLDEIKNWLKQAKELKVKYVIIDGIFEPLTNQKDTLNILEYLQELEIRSILITNLTLMTKDIAKRLKELNVAILGKLNVPIVNKHDINYGKFAQLQSYLMGLQNKNIYDVLISNINLLIDYGFNKLEYNKDGCKTTRLGLQTIITHHNIEYLPTLASQTRDLNIFFLAERVKPQGAAVSDEFYISPFEFKELDETIKSDNEKLGYYIRESTPAFINGTCLKHLGTVNININGDVIPCPSVEFIIGNLRKEKLKDIINSYYAQILRNIKDHIQGDCKHCELFKNLECYAGCRGYTFMYLKHRGFSDYEALVASDPSCWKVKQILNGVDKKNISISINQNF